MSIHNAQLRKLLRLFYAKDSLRRRILLDDLRTEDSKKRGEKKRDGGDFFVPFWSDAKDHVAGRLDLLTKTNERIEKNKRLKRLYPLLANNFLEVWNAKIRWRNEPFEFHAQTLKGQFSLDELSTVVRIENVLSVRIWDGSDRAIYPYFNEEPTLPPEGVRLAFWALELGLTNVRRSDLRVMDMLRGAYYRSADHPPIGDEKTIFVQRYKSILDEWDTLQND